MTTNPAPQDTLPRADQHDSAEILHPHDDLEAAAARLQKAMERLEHDQTTAAPDDLPPSPTLPPIDPSYLPPAPLTSDSAWPLGSSDPRIDAGQWQQAADPPPPPSPFAPTREAVGLGTLALIAAIILLLWRKPQWRERLVHTIRQRAALVICLGLALTAASFTIIPEIADGDAWRDMIDGHWLTFFGLALALTGVFHWISGPPDVSK